MTPINIAITICIALVVIVLCVTLYRYFTSKKRVDAALIKTPRLISDVAADGPIDGRVKAKLSKIGNEYTYNIWVKVTDPGTSANPKCILYRSSKSPHSDKGLPANPSIWLKQDNSLMVRVSTLANINPNESDMQDELYPKYNTASVGDASYTIVNPLASDNKCSGCNADPNVKTSACDVNNIPMLRWVMITAVLWNQTLDVYINGKLIRSCILPGMPLHDANALKNIYIGGATENYNGHVSRMRYLDHAITAEDVMALYKKGPVPVTWWWQTMRNRVKVMLEIGTDDD